MHRFGNKGLLFGTCCAPVCRTPHLRRHSKNTSGENWTLTKSTVTGNNHSPISRVYWHSPKIPTGEGHGPSTDPTPAPPIHISGSAPVNYYYCCCCCYCIFGFIIVQCSFVLPWVRHRFDEDVILMRFSVNLWMVFEAQTRCTEKTYILRNICSMTYKYTTQLTSRRQIFIAVWS